MTIETPWLIETNTLEAKLDDANICIVDVTSQNNYLLEHIPGAVFLNYPEVIKNTPPIFGLLPDSDAFSAVLSSLGITPDSYVIAYDEEGGGKASRLLWTLEIAGHKKMSLLNGGIQAWKGESKALDQAVPNIENSSYPVEFKQMDGVADAEYILSKLGDKNICIIDARSANEFNGSDVRASRGGHIPGAKNLDWMELKDNDNFLRLKSKNALKKMLDDASASLDKEIITHCHSHHRSALTYIMLKSLGYENVKGYPGSWSDWAPRENTPVEI